MNRISMRRVSMALAAAVGVFLTASMAWCGELTPNLVQDGGIEQWEEVLPTGPGWNGLNFTWKTWQFSKTEKGGLLRPVFLNQPSDYHFKGILQREDSDVHGGKHALRLKGGFYLNGKDGEEGSYRTAEGDVFVSRYWVKGAGQVRMNLTVYGDGQSVLLEQKGAPQKDKWTLIEERCLILGQAPTQINPFISASEEMLIDDIFVGRVLREKESLGKSVPEDCGERVVFASEVSDPPVIDGKLDDECWQTAMVFSGFRSYNDQVTLAGLQTLFRVLRDESALYIGMEIILPNARQELEELAKQPLMEKPGVPQDKCADLYKERHSVELFLQPPGRPTYYQYVVSLDGYRYDGAGQDAKWNSEWTFAITVGEDRWFLEMRIPAKDMGLERITHGEEWTLNVVRNKEMGYSTWSAVGGNFHNPAGFGTLLMMEFKEWRAVKTKEWESVKGILRDAKDPGFDERLRRLDAFSSSLGAGKEGGETDWETVTRRYGRLAFIDWSYRVMREELCYKRFFKGP